MLKKRDLQDCHILYSLITHPDIFPYVRHKPNSYEEYIFITKQMIEAEDRGELISRTILDEWGNPIGTITLFDIANQAGFLGTWLGKPYHGKGYNQLAKEAFFQELFFEKNIETVFLRINTNNHRSIKAAEKLPFVIKSGSNRSQLINSINQNPHGLTYHLYEIPKDLFTMHYKKNGLHYDEHMHSLKA